MFFTKNATIGGIKRSYRVICSRIYKNAAIGPNLWFSCSRVFKNAAIGSIFFLLKHIPAQNKTCNSCLFKTKQVPNQLEPTKQIANAQ